MSKGIVNTIIGAAELAVGIFMEFIPGLQLVGAALISAGAGMVLSGVGTIIAGSGGNGRGVSGAAARNPIAPWNAIYGRSRAGGTLTMERR